MSVSPTSSQEETDNHRPPTGAPSYLPVSTAISADLLPSHPSYSQNRWPDTQGRRGEEGDYTMSVSSTESRSPVRKRSRGSSAGGMPESMERATGRVTPNRSRSRRSSEDVASYPALAPPSSSLPLVPTSSPSFKAKCSNWCLLWCCCRPVSPQQRSDPSQSRSRKGTGSYRHRQGTGYCCVRPSTRALFLCLMGFAVLLFLSGLSLQSKYLSRLASSTQTFSRDSGSVVFFF